MVDKFNRIEQLLKEALEAADSLEAVQTFREKLENNLEDYYGHQLPAVAIHAVGMTPQERRLSGIDVAIEVVDCSGDLQAADSRLKQIVSEVVDFLRRQDPTAGGHVFVDHFQGIRINNVTIIPPNPIENEFIVSSIIDATILIIE